MTSEQRRALDYLQRKGPLAGADTLRSQLREAFASIERAFDDVAGNARERTPAPGKWSPHEILDHLVLSHEPAIAQLQELLAGVSPPAVAIPADLHRPAHERPDWDDLRSRLGETHRQLLQRAEAATDDSSLDPKVVVEMVVKVGSEPVHWLERLDWKAFVQAIRVHTLEHRNQLERAVGQLRSSM